MKNSSSSPKKRFKSDKKLSAAQRLAQSHASFHLVQDGNVGPGTYKEYELNNVGDKHSIKYTHGVKYPEKL